MYIFRNNVGIVALGNLVLANINTRYTRNSPYIRQLGSILAKFYALCDFKCIVKSKSPSGATTIGTIMWASFDGGILSISHEIARGKRLDMIHTKRNLG